jgi:hypothetical protein
MFPQRHDVEWFINRFWPDIGPYEESEDLNSILSSPDYWTTGFLSLKWAIEKLFLENV